ncbi:MAG: tyrosine-type recombinase/integrase [Candidatus Metalachnospira sp.]|nr:tyrosine-type recombinase/integrase [Candidatus Metalachnospira sp.]
MAKASFHDEEIIKNTAHLKGLLEQLPPFLFVYFRGIAQTTSVKTRIGYAYDLKIFFNFLCCSNKNFINLEFDDIDVKHLELITPQDIEEFLDYVSSYTPFDIVEEQVHPTILLNAENAKSRKLAAIRSMFKYFLKKQYIKTDPAALVDTPKIHEKNIIRLEANEVADLLDEVESGENLTDRQKCFHEKTKIRDLAIITTLVGTGIRVSECVGLNTDDINFDSFSFSITRKGGKEAIIYFGDEVAEALSEYLAYRKDHPPLDVNNKALFLSCQRKRIDVRTVQNLVKKYSQVSVKLKKITPHKLRSTFGTNLYLETGDIYLVADVLGHADVNTTRKHYTATEIELKRKAARKINLRKD